MPDFLHPLCALFNNNAPPTCSCRCAPHVTSHLSWNWQRADRSGRFHATWNWVTIPRYVLQCPDMTGPLVGRAPVRFAFCHRLANTENASSLLLSHLLRAEFSISSLSCAPGQTMLPFAPVHRSVASAKVTIGARTPEQQKEHPISCQRIEKRWLCGTSTAMTRADLVGTTLKGTETFVSRLQEGTTAAERFENIGQPNQQYHFK
ncbi:hypothetical protein BGZ60DRAFT_68048 [Tricladium varicosporioides]|nr:hypothetical protein BGZ60DRAFT_68048 [Hymenoscyphus varicosporioides]